MLNRGSANGRGVGKKPAGDDTDSGHLDPVGVAQQLARPNSKYPTKPVRHTAWHCARAQRTLRAVNKIAVRPRAEPLAPATVTGRLLTTLLDSPALVQQLRTLPAPAVHNLVRRVGMEDAGELLALLTVNQLTLLLDDVLWRAHAPGADESFSLRRFVTWLEVMLEAGDTFVADRLAELSEDLLTLAISRFALVFDLVEVEAEASARDEGELVEKALDSSLYQEIDSYLLIARHHDGWDALVTALVALDERHSDVLDRVLHRCWRSAHEQLDDAGGLYALLTAEDVLEVDAAAEREDRRAALGYVSPASARAFLGLARQSFDAQERGSDDAITRAYFRNLDADRARQHQQWGSKVGDAPPIAGLLEAALSEPLVSSPADATGTAETAATLRPLLEELAQTEPERHARAIEELAYLANVLVAGDPSSGRPWRAAEAAEHVMHVCECGLVELAARDAGGSPCHPSVATIRRWGLVAAFRAGWTAAAD